MAVGEKEGEGTVVKSSSEKNDSVVVSSGGGEKKKTKRKGLFSRIWNVIFRVRGDDFEKRLKNILKEEVTVRNRMKRRSITRRKFIRNLIVFSVFFEIIAVGYAIMTTRDEDLDWKLRSFRILPMFLLPVVASLAYCSFVGFWRMYQHALEKLQTELVGKINELKERTNYTLHNNLFSSFVCSQNLGLSGGISGFSAPEALPNVCENATPSSIKSFNQFSEMIQPIEERMRNVGNYVKVISAESR